MNRCFFGCSLCVVLLLSCSHAARADNWPQWRGVGNDGVCKESGLLAEWGDGKNIVWQLPMPAAAGSTPAVWGDRIFLTSEDGPETLVLCVSTQGKELWRQKLGTHNNRKYMSGEANNASASPSTDGQHVWAFDGAGHLACFTVDGIAPLAAQKGDALLNRPTGGTLRTYRLAVGCTGEYAAAAGGGTVSGALGAILTTINRVSAIYERDFAIRLKLVNNEDKVIFTDAATDGYTNNAGATLE